MGVFILFIPLILITTSNVGYLYNVYLAANSARGNCVKK